MARKSKYTFRPDCEGLEGRQLMSTITNVFNGKVLDDSGYSTSNGTQIILYHQNGETNQQWNFVSTRQRQLRDPERVQRQGPGRPGILDEQRDRHHPV